MGDYITQSDVMTRLLSLTALDVATGTLDGASFIPASEAAFLVDSGVTYASLTANQQTLAKAAMISFCAALVVASAPTEKIEGVNGAITPISAVDKERMNNLLIKEYQRYKALVTGTSWINSTHTKNYNRHRYHSHKSGTSGWGIR
jgi:hypothetical protein